MNLNVDGEHKKIASKLAAVISFCLLALIMLAVFVKAMPKNINYKTTNYDYQSIKILGKVLLNEYAVPFEYASILLLTAMIGAVLLSKKENSNT